MKEKAIDAAIYLCFILGIGIVFAPALLDVGGSLMDLVGDPVLFFLSCKRPPKIPQFRQLKIPHPLIIFMHHLLPLTPPQEGRACPPSPSRGGGSSRP